MNFVNFWIDFKLMKKKFGFFVQTLTIMAFREFFLQRDNIYLLSIMIKLLRFSAILLCFVLVVFVKVHDALCTQREILSSRCNI